MKASLKTIADQPSWVVRSSDVELAVTQLGGHMAPVTFYRKSRTPVQPYYVNPWHGEGHKIDEPVLVPLRGDFFCLPFGENGEYRGVKHNVHGEPAGNRWTFRALETSGRLTRLTLSMSTRKLPGKITKHLALLDGQNVVYVQHVLEGFSCSTSLGHHATLAVPETEGALRVATSPIRFGMSNPLPTGDPATGEYPSIVPHQRFQGLSKVALIWKDPPAGDLSALPARTGFTDLVAVFNKRRPAPAWTTATVDELGYLWFSLKDPAVLPTTILWISNRGRHMPPWNGRNRCLGLEDVCGFFAMGLAASTRSNALSRQGVGTSVRLSPKAPAAINYIEGVVRIPRGFRKVRAASFAPGKVTFTSVTGKKVTARVNHAFLATGEL
ncbi:MAG TPA: hypothetical protein VMZ50_04760 [Phycisphaerae bacterium]|nr:hypothetical protein [Phycisphaerae bacterium]